MGNETFLWKLSRKIQGVRREIEGQDVPIQMPQMRRGDRDCQLRRIDDTACTTGTPDPAVLGNIFLAIVYEIHNNAGRSPTIRRSYAAGHRP